MRRSIPIITTAAAAIALVPAGAAPAQGATVREFEGTVVSVDRDSRSFRLRDCERGVVRVRVTRNTRFERIDGLRGLRRGQTNIETVVRRIRGRWVAREVERSGGGGEHGGCDDDDRRRGGDDDHGRHGDDDGHRRRGRGRGRGGDD